MTDEQMSSLTDRETNGWTHRLTDTRIPIDRQTDRHTQTHGNTEREKDKEKDREKGK